MNILTRTDNKVRTKAKKNFLIDDEMKDNKNQLATQLKIMQVRQIINFEFAVHIYAVRDQRTTQIFFYITIMDQLVYTIFGFFVYPHYLWNNHPTTAKL